MDARSWNNLNNISGQDHELYRRRTGNSEKWKDLNKFLWNKKTKEFLGYDLRAWGKQIAFYSAFYTGLLAFFLVCMLFFSLALDEISPTMQSLSSPLQELPGMSFRPSPDFETTLIRFIQGQPSTYKPYTDHIQAFLKQYENDAQVGENFIDCSFGRPPGMENKVCRFNVDLMGPRCTWQKDYGYDEGQPCVILKLNKIFNWRPQTFEVNSTSGLPDSLLSRLHPEYVGVTCRGLYELDTENIGNVSYWPPEGFSRHFYPYLNQEGYRSPLVMVQFNNPINGIVVNVICEAWAKNITPRRHVNDQLGLVIFSLLVD